MPLVQNSVSVAAGGTLKVMADSIYEILPFNAKLEFAVLGSATGLLASISSGSDILLESSPVGVGTGANVLPKYPDDFHLQDVAGRGEKIKFTVTNPTGGALTANVAVRITPF